MNLKEIKKKIESEKTVSEDDIFLNELLTNNGVDVIAKPKTDESEGDKEKK